MKKETPFDLTDLWTPAWVRIDGGAFRMGSNSGPAGSRPAHDVRLTEFRISRYPVTNAQYDVFLLDTGRAAPRHWHDREMPDDSATHPVTHVSWDDAQAFCAWLTERAGAAEGTAHLPTEAQWEFAARGTEGRQYPWGDQEPSPERANYQESAVEGTTAVGSYSSGATPEGVHDLAGNVRQWCLDWYGDYEARSGQDPAGPREGQERALRGGSFVDAPGTLRSWYRFKTDPAGRFGFVGFRVAWSSLGPNR
ncbi:MAG: formylglycine-generating enzyme family protein [Acidobacteriota bacterium]|jgi:formylglycine-generating enzyme required for sulfatase activity